MTIVPLSLEILNTSEKFAVIDIKKLVARLGYLA